MTKFSDTNGGAPADGQNSDDETDFGVFVAELSSRLSNVGRDELDPALDDVLRRVCEYADADRAYVFAIHDQGRLISNTHEWVRGDTLSHRDELQQVPASTFPWLMERLEKLQSVVVRDTSALPEAARAEREEFERENIRSLMVVPVAFAGDLYGFVGLDAVHRHRDWRDRTEALLRILGHGIANALERRRASQAVAEHQALYRTIVSSIREGIWMLDSNLNTEYVNEPLAEMLGYRPEEMIGHPVPAFMFEEDIRDARSKLKRAKEGIGSRYERRYRHREGHPVHTEISVNPRLDEEGRYQGSLAIVLDITDRKRMDIQQQTQSRVMEGVARGRPVEEVLAAMLHGLDRLADGHVFAILFHLADGKWEWTVGERADASVREMLSGLAAEGDRLSTERIGEIASAAGCPSIRAYPLETITGDTLAWGLRLTAESPPPDEPTEGRISDLFEHGRIALLHESSRRQLIREEERFRTLLDHSPDAIVVLDADAGHFTIVNDNAEQMFGYTRKELMEIGVENLLPEYQPDGTPSREVAGEKIRECLEGGTPRFEIYHMNAAGEPFPAEVRLVRLPAPAGQRLVRGSIMDITERRAAERDLRFLASRDHLTHLLNRTLFVERLDHALAVARRNRTGLAVLFLDLDRFKHINDNLGHAAGDRLLMHVANALRDCLRDSDTIGRFGGDEFVILLEGMVELKDAATVARKVLGAVSKPFQIDDQEVYSTTSIGIGTYPKDGTDADALVKAADSAMYAAKDLGGNGYQFFTPELNARAADFMRLERELHQALARDEFELFYQPKIDLQTGRACGAEALIRWRHPERGLVSPGEFIPVAEDTGQIVGIGEWALEEAARQAVIWRDHRREMSRPPLAISVNLSARQLRQGRLDRTVEKILVRTGLPTELLELEITESMVMENADYAIEILAKIRDTGVRISIDDFGTGYSSLGYLKRLPIDVVKIDRSFIRELETHRGDREITAAVIAMAHALNLRVVAEGVETAGQLRVLQQVQCDEIQGFLVARPVPAADMRAWVSGDWSLSDLAETE